MIDITQTMACIQCGACVSDCLSMEVDPLFIGPAALAKAYRFVGDPRDGQHEQRLKDLSEDPHGIYDCTHCFNCIEACPKGVAPMSQIMRLRRIARPTTGSTTATTATATSTAFVNNIERNGLLHEADLLPDSYGGKFHPRAVPELLRSLPVDPEGAPARQGDAEEGAAAPAQGAQGGPADLRPRPRQGRALRAQPLRRGRRGRGRDRRESEHVKVAYWPGCVSRGFTPELHGSMAQVAPLLDIELVELDRASCCGAGVIAEHNQELADTLNARTFALAQQEIADGAELMMNICSTCQGAQSECQERLDGNSEYREHINETLAPEGLTYEKGISNKNFLWLMVEEIGLDAIKAKVKRPLTDLRVGPFYGCYIVRPTDRLGIDSEHPRDRYLQMLIEALGGTVVDYAGQYKCCGFPIITMNKRGVAEAGGPPPRRRDRRRRRLPRHAVPAVPPQPGPAAAAAPRRSWAATLGHAGAAPAAARRPRARARAQGARDEQARRQADVGDRLVDLRGRRGRRRLLGGW